MEVQSSPIVNLLDDAVRGFCFPNTVRTTPVFAGQSVSSWQSILKDKSDEAKKTTALVRAKATAEALTEPKQTIDGCLSELDALIKVMDARLESFSPSLSNLHAALEDAQLMVASLWPKGSQKTSQKNSTAPADSPATGSASEQAAPPAPANSPTDLGHVVIAREAVYAQLTQAAEALATLEPHSPIPYLVRRAVELGKLPFPQLVQKLIREETILSELQREFGLSATSAEPTNTPTTSA
jgi:type VI secretion system protein ImpA